MRPVLNDDFYEELNTGRCYYTPPQYMRLHNPGMPIHAGKHLQGRGDQ